MRFYYNYYEFINKYDQNVTVFHAYFINITPHISFITNRSFEIPTGLPHILHICSGGLMIMKKTLAALTLSAALAASGAAFAQQADSAKAAQPTGKQQRMNADDRAALTDAKIAGLKAGLKLNADQEKLWPGVEKALRDAAQARAERMAKWKEERKEAREDGKKVDYVERLRKGADMATERATEMRKLADGIDPLYKTLDDGQKRRLAVLLRANMPGKGDHHHKGGPRR